MRSAIPLLLVAACGEPLPFEGWEEDEGPGFEVVVEPATIEIVTGPEGAEPVAFTATAIFRDGTEAVLEAADWRLSNRSVGALDPGGVFTPSTTTGGRTWVSAELDGAIGRADVLVRYDDVIVNGDVPADAFDAEATKVEAAAWLYPADGVALPRNTPSLEFQWRPTEGAVYELAFTSEVTSIRVRTSEPSFTADADTWARIAATNAGGSVEAVLRTSVGGVVTEEPPRTFAVNRLDATGAILYWSTTKAGLVQIPFGANAATPWWTQAESGKCVGCHAVSSDGKVAYTYDGGNGPIGIRRFGADPTAAAILSYPADATTAPRGNFFSFSPDGKLLLAAYLGNLALYDAETGTFLQDVLTDGKSTHPAWSPDGTQIAFVRQIGRTPSISGDWFNSVPGSQLAVLEYLGTSPTGQHLFGPWSLLVAPSETTNVYYPTFSPDGAWIAFNQSSQDMVSDPDASLWVVDAAGKLDPIRLEAADGDPAAWDACTFAPDPTNAPEVYSKGMFNSWPRWAPLPDDDVLWLAFSSSRAYGAKTSCRPQIWVTSFDPEKARKGQDPSTAAFWLPGQDLTDGNHIPVWMRSL